MRPLAAFALALSFAACQHHNPSPDGGQDLSTAVDDMTALGGGVDFEGVTFPDLAVQEDLAMKLACGEPDEQCCYSPAKGLYCDAATATCNAFGVCVACGLYPLNCCPGGTCLDNQACLPVGSNDYCYPCGQTGEPCCFDGAPCRDGSSCIIPDGFSPVCG
jgi:hypothetical protein